jgi:hypothetical protein
MNTRVVAVMLCFALFAGCGNEKKEKQLQDQLVQTEMVRDSIEQLITERDHYLEQVVRSVNEVYADLELARVKEGKVLNRAGAAEKSTVSASLDTREGLLKDISEIGSVLQENRKRINLLETRSRKARHRIASLDTLIENLKQTLAQREQSIALLEAKVKGLEETVADNTRTMAQKDFIIENQQKKIGTGYYIVGTRDELRKKGIITDEGGFLWGLLGSTTVLVSGVDEEDFTPVDITRDENIHVPGKVEEILPRRQNEFFAMAPTSDNATDLMIVNRDKFWQDRHLVIVID